MTCYMLMMPLCQSQLPLWKPCNIILLKIDVKLIQQLCTDNKMVISVLKEQQHVNINETEQQHLNINETKIGTFYKNTLCLFRHSDDMEGTNRTNVTQNKYLLRKM